MQIHTTARHCELDPEVRQHAEARAEKFGRFARDIHEVNIVVTADRNRFTSEITLRMNGHEVVGREESTDPRLALDLAADRVEHQLRKLKERRLDHRHAGLDADGRATLGDSSSGEV